MGTSERGTRGRNAGAQGRTAIAWLLFLLYIVILMKLALFRDPGSTFRMWSLAERLKLANFVPFRTIVLYIGGGETVQAALRNVAGNVLAFLPMGFLLPVMFPELRGARSVLAVAFAASLALEVVQLLTGLGGFDVDDLLLNLLGAAIGGLLARAGRAW